MSPAQREALRACAAATQPPKINAATARILSDRYGYIEPCGDGWQLTHKGRAHLAGERAEEQRRAAENALPREAWKWATRVEAWLKAHRRFAEFGYGTWSYARHVAACDFGDVAPVRPQGDAVSLEWIEQAVRSAARCLKDFDEAIKLAGERGVGVSVSYEADEKVPRSRRDAARAAVQSAGVTDLRRYRERRPGGAA